MAANVLAAHAAGPGAMPGPPIALPVLKISLSAVAAPPPAAREAAPAPPPAARPPEPRAPLAVEAAAAAVEKIAAAASTRPAERPATLDPAPPEAAPAAPAAAAPRPEPMPLPARRPPAAKVAEPPPEIPRSPVRPEAAPDPARDARQRPQEVASLSADAGAAAATVVHQANYRRRTPPVYPGRALELGQQGTVLLHAEVLPDGQPRDLKVVQSSGHRLLDTAALAAVRKWRFEPTNIDGTAVTSWVRVPVRFVIKQ